MIQYACSEYRVSERRACRIFVAPRSTIRYRPAPNDDEVIKIKILSIAEKRPRFGCPRIHHMLRRSGVIINHKRTERLYQLLGLSLRKKVIRKRYKSETRVMPDAPVKKNEQWSMDFIHDALAAGRKIRGLTIIDLFTKESPAIELDYSLSGLSVISVLERLKDETGLPKIIKVDNGPEFICIALDKWASDNGVKLSFSRPGKPTDNAGIESFNGRLRDEFLNMHWFSSLEQARDLCEKWRIDYNEERPHSSLGYQTPKEFAESMEFMIAS